MIKLKTQIQKTDHLLALVVFGLSLFGLLMVYDASVVEAYHKFSDKYYYLKNQLQWVGLGWFTALVLTKFHYQKLAKFSAPAMLLSIFLLVLVLVPQIGIKILGAKRWINVAGFSLQPAELTKLTFVVYLASWLSKKRSFWPFLFLSGLILGLIILEPDLGTAVVIVTSGFLVYFVSGAPLFYMIFLALLGIVSGATLILVSPYRRQRFLTFLDPTIDPLGASYHIRQILIAIGSGGLFGLGLGKSRQKYEYLPAATTDSIFAVIAEELGFVGGLLIILAFLFLIWRGISIAKEAPDRLSQLLAVGITSWIGVQSLVNLAAMVALVPLTGVPLPFISYGGSSMVTSLAAMGILLNISKYRIKRK
jgi:cell division protein FtsW